MSDLNELLEQEARLVDAAPEALESVLRRRDRKRRNQRIAAGVVGIAVALTVAVGGASLLRSSGRPVPADEPQTISPPSPTSTT